MDNVLSIGELRRRGEGVLARWLKMRQDDSRRDAT
jgi:hypothetical protein